MSYKIKQNTNRCNSQNSQLITPKSLDSRTSPDIKFATLCTPTSSILATTLKTGDNLNVGDRFEVLVAEFKNNRMAPTSRMVFRHNHAITKILKIVIRWRSSTWQCHQHHCLFIMLIHFQNDAFVHDRRYPRIRSKTFWLFDIIPESIFYLFSSLLNIKLNILFSVTQFLELSFMVYFKRFENKPFKP